MGGDNWRVSDEWSEMVIRVTPGPGQPSFLDRSPHVSDPVTSHVTRATCEGNMDQDYTSINWRTR